MKKNLTKLALSGAALAAVAATLGTSTYAWYTTNPTVSANNIVAGTSDTGSSSIFISKDKSDVAKKSWSSKVTLTSSDFMIASPSLVPVSYGNAGKFATTVVDTEANPKVTKLGAAQTATNSVAYVQLHFKSSKTTTEQKIYIKSVSVANTTDVDGSTDGNQLPVADNLLYDGTDNTKNGIPTNKATYSVDFRNALAMAVYNAGTSTLTTANSDAYDVAFSIADKKTGDNPVAVSGAYLVSSGDAQGYFDAVMDYDLADSAKAAAGTMAKVGNVNGVYNGAAIAACPMDGTNYATVNFYIYLDGASQFCYDACQGQQFAINLEFTSDATAAIGYVAPNNG